MIAPHHAGIADRLGARHLPVQRDAHVAVGGTQAVDTDLEVGCGGPESERGCTGDRGRQSDTLDGCGSNGHHISFQAMGWLTGAG